MAQGVLVGCDVKQEWLLSWWWNHFQRKNSEVRVAFADFGMSAAARLWCKKRGALLAILEPSIAPFETLDLLTKSHWEQKWKDAGEVRDLWTLRKTWYKKPMAMSISPFERTLWLDLDCEVHQNLAPLFAIPLSPAKMAASSTEMNRLAGETEDLAFPHYNTGVVLFEQKSPLLALWIREIAAGSSIACTEEDLLSFLVAHFQIPLSPLPPACNWEVLRYGPNPHALITHWMGEAGKQKILLELNSPL